MPASSPPKKGQRLSQKVVESLKKRIENGEFSPGDKLPTEHELIAEFGVSRTVVREALSALKADKLIGSRQGAGAFVLPPEEDETNGLFENNLDTLAAIVEQHELRTAVEVEAAKLAAKRCSPAQMANVHAKFEAMASKVKKQIIADEEDYAFHLAIAEAANSKCFVDFLTLIGKSAVLRSSIHLKASYRPHAKQEKLVLEEHRKILDAITERNPERAAAAMKQHLGRCTERYLSLLRFLKADAIVNSNIPL